MNRIEASIVVVASALRELWLEGFITAEPFVLEEEGERALAAARASGFCPTEREIGEVLDTLGGFPARERDGVIALVREEITPGLHAAGGAG